MLFKPSLNRKKNKLKQEIARWEKEKPLVIAQKKLKQDKYETRHKKTEEKKKLTTSKFLMLFLFISCSIIQAFTLVVTFISVIKGYYDFSALQILITAVIGEVIGYAVYSLKALKENTKGGIIYDTAMLSYENSTPIETSNQEAQG